MVKDKQGQGQDSTVRDTGGGLKQMQGKEGNKKSAGSLAHSFIHSFMHSSAQHLAIARLCSKLWGYRGENRQIFLMAFTF